MPESLYARAQPIVHEVLDLPSAQRGACLDALCAGDAALRAEVDWLIAVSGDDALDAVPQAIFDATAALAADLRIEPDAAGHYRLLRPLGEGGMGVVWLAERQVGSGVQRVALKRLRAGSFAGQARFQDEQRILATLNHPNIAHLVDAGTDAAGAPFLAMEYVDGERIDHWCDARALGIRARVELFIEVCAAMSYAHEQLVIHRDLKPANVLVDADGRPKLLDFGIARLLDPGATTRTATRVMTPAYASPEQIDGRPLGTATDVWSLGVMLYELVAGVHPFAHLDTDHARAGAILSGTIRAPSQQTQRTAAADAASADATPPRRPQRIPADIDAIVLKTLRREPGQRYASVRALADDLGHFLASRPVEARRGQRAYRVRRFVQRHRWPLGIGVMLVAVIAGFTWRTVLAEREARLQAEVAGRTTEFLVSAFSLSDPTQAGRHDFTAREVIDRGRERVEQELAGQPRVRARLLEALGNAYRGINEGNAGATLLEAAAQLNLDPAVDDPLAAARSLRAKATGILAINGSSVEAEHAARRAFDLVQTHAGDDVLALADAYGTLARALDLAGRETQAIDAARQALALRESANAGPLVLAQSLDELCQVTGGIGDHLQAHAYCERARVLYAEAGASHTNAYRLTLRQMERTLVYSGRYDEGLAIARERIALTRELFGEDSSVLAMERVAFTDRLAEHGLFDEAATMLALGAPVILRHNGAHSVQHAQAIFHAGWLEFLLGRFDAAVPPLREALAIHDALVDGDDSGRLQVLRTTLAMALIESGHADTDARALLDAAIAERARSDASAIPLAYARLPLAQWHVAHGEYDAAEQLLDHVDAVGTGVEAELHARAAATRAAILQARGDDAGAARQAQSAYDIILADRGADNPRTARHALRYARLLRATGDIAAADALEREYRPKLARFYPPDSAFRQSPLGN